MKNIFYLILILPTVILTSCEEEDEEMLTQCETVRKQRYSDIEVSNFSVNNSESLFQNYGHQTFPEKKREELHPFAQLWEFTNVAGTVATCKLHFARIGFDDDDCNPEFEHQIHLTVQLDQKPFETKTYSIESVQELNFASYGGELISANEILRFSKKGAGSLTISKYIPDLNITGNYDINIDGVQVKGSFDYDLSESY